MKSRISEFGTCPLCGKSSEIYLTPKQNYYLLKHKYGNAMVSVRCRECDLELDIFTTRAKSDNYDIMVGELKNKWERLKR